MDNEVLVEAKGVSKKFCKNLKRSLLYGMKDLTNDFMGRKQYKSTLRKDEFWAVKDISFELRRGECLGLIGHNGAGKSTLLKMLNGLIRPDEGEIRMRGRVGALIELGAGFNPILTGRENIYINGQVLGFSKKEIDEKFDSIVEFAEIGEFIDTPVQNYSSGMKVRLGFAIASQMEPEILIIDEVLSVGDVGFQGKCLAKISELKKNTGVIFVSHSMPQINRHCDSCILITKGKKIKMGTTEQVIKEYHEYFGGETGNKYIKPGNELIDFSLNKASISKDFTPRIQEGSKLFFEIKLKLEKKVEYFSVKINILNRDLMVISSLTSPVFQNKSKDYQIISVETEPINIVPGHYKLSLNTATPDFRESFFYYEAWWEAIIEGESDFGSNFMKFRSTWEVL